MNYYKSISIFLVLLFLAGGVVAIPRISSAQAMTSYGTPNFSVLSGRGPVLNYALLPKTNQEILNTFSYSPSEVHQIYNTSSLLKEGIDGKGVTIAIVDPF